MTTTTTRQITLQVQARDLEVGDLILGHTHEITRFERVNSKIFVWEGEGIRCDREFWATTTLHIARAVLSVDETVRLSVRVHGDEVAEVVCDNPFAATLIKMAIEHHVDIMTVVRKT